MYRRVEMVIESLKGEGRRGQVERFKLGDENAVFLRKCQLIRLNTMRLLAYLQHRPDSTAQRMADHTIISGIPYFHRGFDGGVIRRERKQSFHQ